MGLALVLSSLFYFVALQMQIQACNGCLEKERIGLLEIKAYFLAQNGDFAGRELVSWVEDGASNCCSWHRLKCANISTGPVTELSLNDLYDFYKPYVKLNVSLFRPFEDIRNLNLSGNGYDDWIDNEGFSSLKKLETLDLSNNDLNNSILPSLIGLTSLRTLKLNSNQMTHSFLSKGLSNLKKLETLDLSWNFLNASILPSLNGLTSLRTLKLNDNQMKGSSTAQDLQNWRSLEVLHLGGNQLNGSIEGLCNLKCLVELDLSGNRFNGQLPKCLSMLMKLQVLDLSHNLFSGNFPSFTNNLTSLTYLSLSGNYMQGLFSLSSLANHSKLLVLHISSQSPRAQVETEKTKWFPTFRLKSVILRNCNLNMDSGSTIPSFLLYQNDLQHIDISHNKLVGAFPGWMIQNNSRLETLILRSNLFMGKFQLPFIRQDMHELDISNNNIRGCLPKDIGSLLPNIENLNLSMNKFEGSIPESIGKMSWILFLDLSHNHFSGELPKQLGTDCIQLRILKLSYNCFQGNIPSFSNLTFLKVVSINNNNFSGTLKEVLSSIPPIDILDISNNSIIGEIPKSIGMLSEITILLMAENQLEGEVPYEISNMTYLQMLDLSENRLFGSLPNFSLSFLSFLYLQKNAFSGNIPFTLSESTELITLDLRDNKFSGKIPFWMNKLSELRVLLLGGNNLHGHIPVQFCELKNITIMDLSRNMISGSIPSCFKSLFGMTGNDGQGLSFQIGITSLWIDDVVQATVEFRTKSNYYSYRGDILKNMTGLDLSCNDLTGLIPSGVGDLQQIHSLNLSHNYLSGPIPNSFSNLTQIESLDLSYNNLSGEIPSQLTQLHFLSIFNVSYNNLSGIPPSAGQFANYDEENYKGNFGLCGPLLRHKCEGVAASPPSQSNNTRGKETLVDMAAFYASFIAAYITILLGLITVLCINAHWRMTWFYFVGKVIRKCFPTFSLF